MSTADEPLRELSEGECRAAAALFAVAVRARLPVCATDSTIGCATTESESSPGDAWKAVDAERDEAPSSQDQHAVLESWPVDIVLPAEVDAETMTSATKLCDGVFTRLGVPETGREELARALSGCAGQTVGTALEAQLIPIAPPTISSQSGVRKELLCVLMRHLVSASFEHLQSVLAAQQEGEDQGPEGGKEPGAGEKVESQSADAASCTRVAPCWLDARSAHALFDLSRWLEADGAPDRLQLELWMAKSAVHSMRACEPKEGVAGERASKPADWDLKRILMVSGATVGAGAVLAITGGLAAPSIAAGLTSAASVFGVGAATAVSEAATGAVITTALGGIGAGYGANAMIRRTGEVKEFGFLLITAAALPEAAYVTVICEVCEQAKARPVTILLAVKYGEDESPQGPLGMVQTGLQTGLDEVGNWFSTAGQSFKNLFPKSPHAASSAPESGAASESDNHAEADSKGNVVDPVDLDKRLDEALASEASEGAGPKETITKKEIVARWRNWAAPDPQLAPWPRPALGKVPKPQCTVCVAGWAHASPGGFVAPFEALLSLSHGWGEPEVYCLLWESKELVALHNALEDLHNLALSLTKRYATKQMKKMVMRQIIDRLVLSAISTPSNVLSVLQMFIEHEWDVAVDRADKAGVLLAQTLVGGGPATRPVRLVGFSVGSRLIFSCLLELARLGHRGIVAEVVMLGAPVAINPTAWVSARSVVTGRLVNGYYPEDLLLRLIWGFNRPLSVLEEATCAGLQAVSAVCPEARVEDVDLLARGLVGAHTEYPRQMKHILGSLGFCEQLPQPPQSGADGHAT